MDLRKRLIELQYYNLLPLLPKYNGKKKYRRDWRTKPIIERDIQTSKMKSLIWQHRSSPQLKSMLKHLMWKSTGIRV